MEFNELLLKGITNLMSKKSCVQGFDCGYIDF